MKKTLLIIFIILLIAAFGAVWKFSKKELPQPVITNFEECAKAGYPILETYPEQCRTPDGRSFTKSINSSGIEFGSSVTLRLNEQLKFNDGLTVTLVEINDSRCKSGVVCVWAGELAFQFKLLGGNINQDTEIKLGTVMAKSVTQGGYTFTLKEATENASTITVTKEDGQVACTQEVKLCPDGSAVGRTGPNCEFAPCPVVNPIGKQCSDSSDTSCPEDFNCVEGCGPPVATSGSRAVGVVEKFNKTAVPPDHKMVQLVLKDGRKLLVSPGHPTIDGRTVGDLAEGDMYDGSQVSSVELVSYGEGYTYDLLPSGETGFYFANGILVDSTLH